MSLALGADVHVLSPKCQHAVETPMIHCAFYYISNDSEGVIMKNEFYIISMLHFQWTRNEKIASSFPGFVFQNQSRFLKFFI